MRDELAVETVEGDVDAEDEDHDELDPGEYSVDPKIEEIPVDLDAILRSPSEDHPLSNIRTTTNLGGITMAYHERSRLRIPDLLNPSSDATSAVGAFAPVPAPDTITLVERVFTSSPASTALDTPALCDHASATAPAIPTLDDRVIRDLVSSTTPALPMPYIPTSRDRVSSTTLAVPASDTPALRSHVCATSPAASTT